MSVLLIGGDRIGSITQKLKENGFDDIQHVTGRKHGNRKIKISPKTDLVLIFVDFVEHNLVEIVKKESKRIGVRVEFSKRSWISMESTIKGCINDASISEKYKAV
ncbi:DUF2325 domain-containing protein [Clostridium akagii]|uniref:DUF2325 domain-containing protein n=1 Tax=Clostridium akagii TaxID=91623 RepID=UPI00047E9599|nr:DUF2325 domain-containing protein [Clostridium akagii]